MKIFLFNSTTYHSMLFALVTPRRQTKTMQKYTFFNLGQTTQEAQLSLRDHVRHCVIWNLVNDSLFVFNRRCNYRVPFRRYNMLFVQIHRLYPIAPIAILPLIKCPPFSYVCSFCKCWQISIIFGTPHTELMCNITAIYLPTSTTYCCYTTMGIEQTTTELQTQRP